MPNPSKPKKSTRPFRGPTPHKVFQTVDLGAGWAGNILNYAKRFRRRRYAAVDIGYKKGRVAHERVAKLNAANVVTGYMIHHFLNRMKREGVRTRHFNFQFMNRWDLKERSPHIRTPAIFKSILDAIPHVLYPNGKMYITTPFKRTVEAMQRTATRRGFKCRVKEVIEPTDIRTRRGTYITIGNRSVYLLDITYGLKKAFSDKSKRMKWPRIAN